jgi:DNA-binding NarL/FixJ family response regulator
MPEITSVLIADDHPIFRRGLFEIIEESDQFHVIAEVDDGEKALLALREMRPAIAVLDIDMPVLGGLDVLVKTNHWGVKPIFVILTMYDDEIYLRKALEFGALGYLLKDNAESELITCLQDVLAGKQYISPSLSQALGKSSTSAENLLKKLTPTERKVFLLIADYKTNHEIAELLSVSIRTIEKHRANICLKLNLHGHNALIKFATQEH